MLLALVAALLPPFVHGVALFFIGRRDLPDSERWLLWVPLAGSVAIAARNRRPARALLAMLGGLAAAYLASGGLAACVFFAFGVPTRESTYAVSEVRAGSPADGVLRAGDRIYRVGDTRVTTDQPLSALIEASGGRELQLEIQRGSAVLVASVTPTLDDSGWYRLGIELVFEEIRRPATAGEIATHALVTPTKRIGQFVAACWEVIAGEERAVLLGPVGISDLIAHTDDDARRADIAVLVSALSLFAVFFLDLVMAIAAAFRALGDRRGAAPPRR